MGWAKLYKCTISHTFIITKCKCIHTSFCIIWDCYVQLNIISLTYIIGISIELKLAAWTITDISRIQVQLYNIITVFCVYMCDRIYIMLLDCGISENKTNIECNAEEILCWIPIYNAYGKIIVFRTHIIMFVSFA